MLAWSDFTPCTTRTETTIVRAAQSLWPSGGSTLQPARPRKAAPRGPTHGPHQRCNLRAIHPEQQTPQLPRCHGWLRRRSPVPGCSPATNSRNDRRNHGCLIEQPEPRITESHGMRHACPPRGMLPARPRDILVVPAARGSIEIRAARLIHPLQTPKAHSPHAQHEHHHRSARVGRL